MYVVLPLPVLLPDWELPGDHHPQGSTVQLPLDQFLFVYLFQKDLYLFYLQFLFFFNFHSLCAFLQV